MKIRQLHPWNVSAREAIEIQKRLRPLLNLKRLSGQVRYVAGADVSCKKNSNQFWAGVLVFSFPDLNRIEERWVKGRARFPYIPGLLSFRELPGILEAVRLLETEPDLILCDGQGIAHPRALGLASHLGLLLDRPVIGCAKNRLVGEYSKVGDQKGHYAPLVYRDHVIGAVLRTREKVKPLFVSPGNRITLEDSLKMVLDCCPRYRIPEPIRHAHLLVKDLTRKEGSG